jgi:TolB-like protein/tetratricopeptide (TPR) repeat protein
MALAPGDRLGPYEIDGLLGAGGMGEVYRGVDSRLGRAVALKVISQRLVGDEPSRRRFESEARAASALNHPAIVTIYDVGESGGISWIAMELVEGRTLRDVLAQGALPIRQAWSVARQCADGLAAAHAKGIVHRDLKPENVMMTDEGAVKILDFGVARQLVAPGPGGASAIVTVTSAETLVGGVVGTVGYMSPEQATGQAADFRSDQFSFGAVVYELLSGERAFQRPTAIETLSAILRDEPPSLTSARGDASQALQRVIGRCLEKEPARRFGSTRELVAALESLTPEASAVVPAAARPQPRPLRARRVAVLAAIVGAVAVTAGAFLWDRSSRAAPPAIGSVAVLPFDNTAHDPDIDYIGDGLTDGLIEHLTRAKPLKVMAHATVMRFRGQANPLEAAHALGVGAVVTGTLARRGTQIVVSAELINGATGERIWGQTYDRPIADLMRVQDSIVVAIAGQLRLRLSGEEMARLGGSGTSNSDAYELFLKGRFLLQKDTEDDDLEARKLFMQAAEKDPNFLDAHLAVASTYGRAASGSEPPGEANAHARAALARAAAIDPSNVGVRIATAGQRFLQTRNWAATEREYRGVMYEPAILRNVQFHPIALFFVAIGRPEEAVALVQRALEIDPGNLESRIMLGNFLLQAGRLDEALSVYDKIAADEPEDDRPLFGVADVHKRRNDFKRAAEARAKAYLLGGNAEAARLFTRAVTEPDYAKAELTMARAELHEAEQQLSQPQLAGHNFVHPVDLARLQMQAGHREQALAGLEQAVNGDFYVGLMLLKVDQVWEPVRADPRFAAIVRRLGIP